MYGIPNVVGTLRLECVLRTFLERILTKSAQTERTLTTNINIVKIIIVYVEPRWVHQRKIIFNTVNIINARRRGHYVYRFNKKLTSFVSVIKLCLTFYLKEPLKLCYELDDYLDVVNLLGNYQVKIVNLHLIR